MPNVATWLRPKDEKWFQPIFQRYPDVRIWNALTEEVPLVGNERPLIDRRS